MTNSGKSFSWRKGVLFVILCVLVGYLVNITVEKAYGACDSDSGGCTTTVSSPKNGVRKYKNDRLGHAGKIAYSAKAKDVILDKLMKVQKQQNARVITRRQMWQKFKKQDTCFFKVSSGPPNTATWTCTGAYRPFPDDADWSREDVDAVICGGMLGIGVGGALATSTTGPWTWVGLGAGWVVCQWQDNWQRAAED